MPRAKKAVVEKAVPAEVKAGEKAYKLRLERVGAGYEAIRYHAITGESWQVDGEKWTKIPEIGDVPRGEYDVQLVTNDQDFTALRIEVGTGTTWLLKNRQWVKVEEP